MTKPSERLGGRLGVCVSELIYFPPVPRLVFLGWTVTWSQHVLAPDESLSSTCGNSAELWVLLVHLTVWNDLEEKHCLNPTTLPWILRTPLGPALKVRLSRKSKKMTEVREGQILGVHLREASVLYRVKQNDQRTTGTKVSILGRCPQLSS